MKSTMIVDDTRGGELVSILKGANEFLRDIPLYEPTPIETTRAELLTSIRDLSEDLRDESFYFGCAQVQIHLCLERKTLLDAELKKIDLRSKGAAANVMKGLEAAKWRTLRSRKKLIRELDQLFTEKRDLAGKIKNIREMMSGLRRIVGTPHLLAMAAAESGDAVQ